MNTLRAHHYATALFVFFVLLTLLAYGLEWYRQMAVYAFFAGWFVALTAWTFVLEHNLSPRD